VVASLPIYFSMIQPVLWIRIALMRILICGCLFYTDPDPTFHPDAEPDPGPSYQIKAQPHEKVLK
jgi:hypothetical protein